MEKSLSNAQRVQLKYQLMLHRQKLYNNKYLSECAFCGQGIEGAPDMHEVFFTKGDVARGNEEMHYLLSTNANCVLVHPGGNASPCHAGAATKDGQKIVIKHLLKWEGYEELGAYIAIVRFFMKDQNRALDAYRLLKEVYDEMQSM